MTHQENLEIVRAACIAANPDIMKLEFGCLILNEKGLGDRLVTPTLTPQGLRQRTDEGFIDISKCKILGRKIGLADVLLAIGKNIRQKPLPKLCLWSVQLEIFDDPNGIDNHLWDLFKDSLTDQSEPTIAFLAGLLAENK